MKKDFWNAVYQLLDENGKPEHVIFEIDDGICNVSIGVILQYPEFLDGVYIELGVI